MAASPLKFLYGLLIVSITLCMVFLFASRLLAWILSRIVGASVGFRFGGWKCLRDIVVKFKKGAVESISVGEIKLSLRQSVVKLGAGIVSKNPKLQILICDLEVVTRPSSKSPHKAKTRKPHSSSKGRGKGMVVANMARFLSVSVTDMVVKTPKATVEVKELGVDVSKDGGSKPSLFLKLNILPIVVNIGEQRLGCDQSCNLNSGGCVSSIQAPSSMMERLSAPLCCEEFSFSCEFGHDREAGVAIQNVDINCGEISVSLNEEMLSKKNKSSDVFSPKDKMDSTTDSAAVNKPPKNQAAILALTKYTSMFPEKICFNLPKLNFGFMHREHDLVVENNIMGIQLVSMKSQSSEDSGGSTRLDVQLDFSEIHILREAGTSILEITKVDIVSSVYIPIQPVSPIRAEIDVKLGGTKCNIIVNRIKPWLRMQSLKKKSMVLREENPKIEKPKSAESTTFMWTCTISAPRMTTILYSINDLPLYHGCSQTSHVFANNISSAGTSVRMELGELNLQMADECQQGLKESLLSVESNSGSLLHIEKVSLDWGKKDLDSSEDVVNRCKLALLVDVIGLGIYFTFKRVESLIVTAMSFQALLKPLSAAKKSTQNQSGHASKLSGKGIQLLKFHLEQCYVNFCGETCLENAIVADPKRVNYGSQGGRVVISVSADGTPRNASIMSTFPDECKRLKYSVSLDICHSSLCVNKEKQSTQLDLERARSIYQEYLEEDKPCTKVALFDIQNVKFVRRTGGLKEIAVCSLFSATDITIRWEPDVHLSLFELVLQLKLLVHNQKLEELGNKQMDELSNTRDEPKKESTVLESGNLEKHKKRESIFAVDVEMLSISAEAGDGVEAMVQVQSIFSENASIGVLLEGSMLNFCGAQIFKSSRMQISRIPSTATSSSDAKGVVGTTWDWRVQALDVQICLPYRLQLRAIDDAVEEMLRALKLVTAAQTKLIFTMKKESSKPKKPNSMKFGRLRFCIRKLTAGIEEEPMQGWLDEHYQLMKNEACELAVRLKLLDDFVSANPCPKMDEATDSTSERKVLYDGNEIDVQDPSAIQKLKEDIYRQSFQSYYQACQKLVQSEGSGACREGFQAGFKPSTARTSVLSASATDLDVILTRIDGGEDGMIEVVKKLDPVSRENDIPFSRLYGSNILLNAGTLAVLLRNYTFPLFSATCGKCEGCVVLAQQATSFQPQVYQDVYIGKWRKVQMLRSASGTTPPMKTYIDLPIHFQKAEVSYGVGYEPVLADISYAFTVALRRAHLSLRGPEVPQPPKKEKSLPWWDEMRNYMHGNITLFFSETEWNILATTDPYEKLNKLQVTSSSMEIQQSDGRVYLSAKDFKIYLSSLESLINNSSLKLPPGVCGAFLEAPVFTVEVLIKWDCESGNPMNHFLFSLPVEGKTREKVFDPFRSTALSLQWNFSLRPSLPASEKQSLSASVNDLWIASPTVNVGAHDMAWIIKFWNLNFLPPHKLRTFSRWPRFGVPRIPRSGNLSLDRVMTEFMLRFDVTPICIKHMPLDDDDPAKGLTFTMTKLKLEMCSSRGKQKYTFECFRAPLDLVYQGVDLHMLKAFFNKEDCSSVAKLVQMARKSSQTAPMERVSSGKSNNMRGCTEKHRDDGFLLSSDYFTIRRQAPKADPARLLAWQEAGRKNIEMTCVRSEFENENDSDEHARSDSDDDDGFNVVIADNCQRVFVYGLKLLWSIENRDAVWSWIGGLSKAFEPPKPSPSRQYTQRKLLEEKRRHDESEMPQEETSKSPSTIEGIPSSSQNAETPGSHSSPSHSDEMENSSTAVAAPTANENVTDSEEEGICHFMVNVVEPQFNLHSEEANGRFLLAAVSGRVLARSFQSVLQVGSEMIGQELGTGNAKTPESAPEMTWKRMEFSVMLEHVQAHVAPTDVDPGAGLQWLPKIRKSSPKVNRTGALLERVFMPCDMYFQYTRHQSGSPDLKVKPLKELTFNSHNITAIMTSRQFQVMLDVLTNLLFARPPKPRKSSLSFPGEDDEDIADEADEVVPDGVEEVEVAKIALEHKEQERKLLLGDIKKLSVHCDSPSDLNPEKEADLWMITGGRSLLVQGLKKELVNAQRARKEASASLRVALQKAAQLRLMEREKKKSPSYAMRISLKINQAVWKMLLYGKPFAETEINDMIYDFDRDYKDVGVAQFTIQSCVIRNCLPNAKSDRLLSPWNPPPEWGKKVMVRVDARQGTPKDGNSIIELLEVEIYPLRIHLTESMYRMMWGYLFPEEEQDLLRRQEVWKVSTTAGARRGKKGSVDAPAPTKEFEVSSKPAASSTSVTSQPANSESAQALKLQNPKANVICSSGSELRRTSSFDRSWEENVAESIANELVQQVNSSKPVKSGRLSHEEKKVGKANEEKKSSRPKKMIEFHNIKISQVELLLTYEGSRFVVNDLKLLMDTFHRVEFTGTWRRLFSRVKKHIIWGVLKSVTGMQVKKFKDKVNTQKEPTATAVSDTDLHLIDNDQSGKADQQSITWPKRLNDGAGDGFVTSIRGIFNTQRRKAKAFVLRTMRGEDNDFSGEWSEGDADFSPFARQLTITKAKKLIRRHTKKFNSRKGSSSQQSDSLPTSPMATAMEMEGTPFESDSSSGSSPYEDFQE